MGATLRALRRLSHKVGFEVRRWPALDPFYENLVHLLRAQGVDVVLDVGGNTGQFARHLRQAGYDRRIVSFEPAGAAHAALAAQAARDNNWTVAPPMALGNHDDQIKLHLFNRSDMNSVHALSTVGREIFPTLNPAGTETVACRRLDGIFEGLVRPGETPFLKLDTQGSERDILEGATGVLSRLPVVQAELSLVPLYEDVAPFEAMYDFLRSHGYRMAMTAPVSFSRKLGCQLEVDAVFVR